MPRIAISVFHKDDGIDLFAKELVALGWEVVSSGGTAKFLREQGVPVTSVKEMVDDVWRKRMVKLGIPLHYINQMIQNDVFCTGDILSHRLLTLRPEYLGGLISDLDNSSHAEELAALMIPHLDAVCCGFYPQDEAIAKKDATVKSVIELLDIGGPTMIDAAAKGDRLAICRVQDRDLVMRELKHTGAVSPETRRRLRAIAFWTVSRYYADTARFLSNGDLESIFGEKVIDLPKGENGHQKHAGLYRNPANNDPYSLNNLRIAIGVAPGYVNWTDVDRLLATAAHASEGFRLNFGEVPPMMLAVKHGNVCSGAVGQSWTWEELKKVVIATATGDPLSSFGGWVLCNFSLNAQLAGMLVHSGMEGDKAQKFDGVIAHGFDSGAIEYLQRKGDKCRCVVSPVDLKEIGFDRSRLFRHVRGGGFLAQDNYCFVPDFRQPGPMIVTGEWDEKHVRDLVFADAVCRTSVSNTITGANNGVIWCNGAGRQSRVGASELCVAIAAKNEHSGMLVGSSFASDSFPPYPDAIQELISAGAKAIFCTLIPGTSEEVRKRNQAMQELCSKSGVTLYQLPDNDGRGFFNH